MTRSIFEKIIDRQIPATIVYEDEMALAFRDINPVAPTHILVVPKKRINKLEDMTQEDSALIGHLCFVANTVAQKENLEGYRLVINNGEQAGQTVFHLHIHVIGGRPLSWPPG
ncbi:MAG: histidine triad nucleotide-binding protein [Deltaproteobacteria bacterium]|nr:histidine triad nucleotide-binding protein [Deltaproteobacteria bacterium]